LETVTISPKYQVVIPKKIRESMKLAPGQQLQVYVLDGSIRLHVPKTLQSLRGIAEGIKWKDILRDRDDRY
jgi:AbrB family looped-hinge helix DNA binding protein